VAIRQDRIMALAFHPELTGEDRLHRFFLAAVAGFDDAGVEE
jgi:5'-phosphate synthase pdxT subunit